MIAGPAGVASPAADPTRGTQPLLRSAYSLMASSAASAVLGMAFWVLAARMFSPATVGRDGALIAALVELSTLCQLNFDNAMVRFLPAVRTRASRVLASAYAVTGAAAVVVGVAFVLLVPLVAEEFRFLTDEPLAGVSFVVALVLWGVFSLQDAALTAMRRATWVPIENGLFGVLKIAALPILLAVGTGHAVFLAWTIPVVLLLAPVNILLFRRVIPAHRVAPGPERSLLREIGRRGAARFLAQDYAASMLARLAATALPLLVVALLGAADNAYFAIPFTIVFAFDMLFLNVGVSLVAEGAMAEERVRHLARAIVRRFVVLLVPGVAVMIVAAPLLLAPFGGDYVEEGTTVLRILACASLARAVVALFVALERLGGRGMRILAVEAALMVVLLGLVVPLAESMGTEGVAVAWVVASTAVATTLIPSLTRSLRRGIVPPS